MLFGHSVAAVFDDQGLPLKLADIGERLNQDMSDFGGGFSFEVGLCFHELSDVLMSGKIKTTDDRCGQNRHRRDHCR